MSVLKILTQPLSAKVNFQDSMWHVDNKTKWSLVFFAIANDLLAQIKVGEPSAVTIALSLASLWLGFLPNRLSSALSCLFIVQSQISVLIVVVLNWLGEPKISIAVASSLWQLWCFGALVRLVMNYIRTPRVH